MLPWLFYPFGIYYLILSLNSLSFVPGDRWSWLCFVDGPLARNLVFGNFKIESAIFELSLKRLEYNKHTQRHKDTTF